MQTPVRIAVVGGGFAGTQTIRELIRLRSLVKQKMDICLFEPRENFVFTPLLHEVATAGLEPGSVLVPYDRIFGREMTIKHYRVQVTRVDLKTRQLYAGQKAYGYDYLVLATGSTTNYFGDYSLKKYTMALKDQEDALAIRFKIEQEILHAAREQTLGKCRNHLTFTVVGGGPTGIELAGEIGQFVQLRIRQAYRMLHGAKPIVRLVQSPETLVPAASKRVQRAALVRLERLGVEVLTNTRVSHVKPGRVTVRRKDGKTQSFQSCTTIWVAGVRPNILEGMKTASRVLTNEDLSLPAHPEVFALGDTATYESRLNLPPLPLLAQAAVQEGTTVARNVVSRMNNRRTRPFGFQSKGFLMSIGQRFAVAELNTPFGQLFFQGFFAWWLWRTIYLFKFMNTGLEVRTAAYWTVRLFAGRHLHVLEKVQT